MSGFKFSTENFRKSFINDIQGPHSNRFIVFNAISDTNSKYYPVSKPNFGKLIDRSKPIVGAQPPPNNDAIYTLKQEWPSAKKEHRSFNYYQNMSPRALLKAQKRDPSSHLSSKEIPCHYAGIRLNPSIKLLGHIKSQK